jgi:hypothetical protein
MRIKLAACVCALAMAATPSQAQIAPGWSYAYVDGAATATHTNGEGDLVATLSCRPPDGIMVLTDHTFGRAARRVTSAAVRVGVMSVTVPATVEGRGGRTRLLINLPQRPPVLAAVQRDDALSVTINNVTHSYGPGSGRQMEELAYACWQGGS